MSTGAIIAIIIVLIVVLSLIGGLLYYMYSQSTTTPPATAPPTTNPYTPPTTTTPYVAPVKTYFTQPNSDWYGFDISNTKVTNIDACASACAANSKCSFFGYHPDGTCYLKQYSSAPGNFSVQKPDGTYMTANGSDLPGFDIKNLGAANINDCNVACTYTTGCVATEYANGMCYLKKPNDASALSIITGWLYK